MDGCRSVFSGVSAVHSTVACGTKRDQVFLRVGTRVAPEFLVVYFQIGHRTARLAPPIVPTQHFLPQCLIRSGSNRNLLPLTLLPH